MPAPTLFLSSPGRRLTVGCLALAGLVGWFGGGTLLAGDERAARPGQELLDERPVEVRGDKPQVDSFGSRLQQGQIRLLAEIADYVATHPEANDRDAAVQWIFTTARQHRLENNVAEIARTISERQDAPESLKRAARQIARLALAQQGDIAEACANVRDDLRGASLRDPETTVDFALDLVAEAQLAGDFTAARHVLDETSTVFFLNQFVRQSFDSRMRKLDLCERQLPGFQLTTLQEQEVSPDNLKGQVVLIDFWATNCPPCLEELPRLKQLHKELGQQGFTIVGISLDDEHDSLNEFVKARQITWPIVQHGNVPGGVRGAFRVDTIPATFLVDRQGRIIASDLRGAELERGIRQALQNP